MQWRTTKDLRALALILVAVILMAAGFTRILVRCTQAGEPTTTHFAWLHYDSCGHGDNHEQAHRDAPSQPKPGEMASSASCSDESLQWIGSTHRRHISVPAILPPAPCHHVALAYPTTQGAAVRPPDDALQRQLTRRRLRGTLLLI